MEQQVITPTQLTITVKCLRSELTFVDKQKPFKVIGWSYQNNSDIFTIF